MAQSLTLTLKESIFNKESTINITPELLEYQNISFSKFEIDEIRYGVKAIEGYRFRIGRIYCIDVKSLSGTVLRIKLKSVYGIRKKHWVKNIESLLMHYLKTILTILLKVS